MRLQNPSYNKNIYYIFQLVVVKPFFYILVRQGLNYSNTLPNKILNVNNTNQLKLKSTYSKILLRTEVKSLRYINTYKRYRRYKKSY